MITLGQRLEKLRTGKNISAAALAAALGMPRLSIEKIEAGRLTPSKEQQDKLAAYFGVTVQYLRGETDENIGMANWMDGSFTDDEPAAPVKAPKIKPDVRKKEDGAVFNLLLKSDAFKTAVLAVLKTPEGQKLIAEAMKKNGR